MTRGLLLDGRGMVEGSAVVPAAGRLDDWRRSVEREQALRRNAALLDAGRRSPYGLTTTTNRYLAYPAAAAGISRASSGGAAWSFSAYTELVPASTITATFYICGLSFVWHTPVAAADTTYEVLIEVATGASSSEVLICQFPAAVRADTAVGYVPHHYIPLPEPKEVAANTRLSVRVAQSLATTSQTYTAIKILYQTA